MQCDECGRELTPDEPIWRYYRRHDMPTERTQPVLDRTTIVSVCEACRPVWYGQQWWFTDTAQAIRKLKDQNAADRRQHSIEPLPDAGLLGPRPCMVCSRPVTMEKRLFARYWDRWLCSRNCARDAVRSRSAVTCATCGRTFEAKGSDATHCSPWCRDHARRHGARELR